MIKKIRQNTFLTIAIGIIYVWFGALKFIPHLSPAENLANDTIQVITFGFIPANISIILLALLEVTIGVFFLLNLFKKTTVIVALGHMICTFIPFFLFEKLTFNGNFFSLTLVGQYIIKNLVLVAALFAIFKMDNVDREKIKFN